MLSLASVRGRGGRTARRAMRAIRRLAPARTDRPVICFGDSLTAGHYPHMLAMRLGVKVENRGVGGETSAQILARVLAFPRDCLAGATMILWMGANDYDSPLVVTNIGKAIAHVGHDRYLVLGVIQGDFPGRDYGIIAEHNAALAGLHFVDIPNSLGGIVPPVSLRIDAIHLNRTGYAIVAEAVDHAMVAKGWARGFGQSMP